jgi:hypothetical protein
LAAGFCAGLRLDPSFDFLVFSATLFNTLLNEEPHTAKPSLNTD